MENKYQSIVDHYENCLEKYGATPKGMDWPNEPDLNTRFKVMLGLIKDSSTPMSLLDLGCGVGLLVDYINNKGLLGKYNYLGLDISAKMVAAASDRHPDYQFKVHDILKTPLPTDSFDYIVMNGVLTEKKGLSQIEMVSYSKSVIKSAYNSCRYGIAFNVMSSHVDWFRDDLFHWSLDDIVSFMIANCSRNISIRMDYGLYEYTIYLYKKPNK